MSKSLGAFARCGTVVDLCENDDVTWARALEDAELRSIALKALTGRRLTKEEGVHLMHVPQEHIVCELANRARKRKVGDGVFFATTLFIHPTNLCELSCPMCSFYAKPGQAKAWFHSPEVIIDKVRARLDQGINEVHIVGGLWRDANLPYYEQIFRGIKALDSKLHIKALTPVEFEFLAELHGLSVTEVLERMKLWGLGSIPGGGAEVLVERVRRQVAPQKITSERYLEIHAIAHQLGIPSNITMLFGHVEEKEDLVTHWELVRALQDKTGGFQAFVPLRYHLENNALGTRSKRIKPKSIRRIYAVSRLMLDNIPNLKVLWNYVGLELAQEVLNCGANDLGSTALEEKIATAAGGIQLAMNQSGMRRAIIQAGRRPHLSHSAGQCSLHQTPANP